MNLFDLLKRKNAFDEYAKNMKPLQPVTGSTPNGQEPNVDLVQVDDTGNLAQNPTQVQQPVSTVEKMKTPRGQRLASFLFGTQAPATDSVDTDNGAISATISESPRVGGVLPNLMNGYRENANNGFSLENLTDNIGLDGRNKGLAYRVGEGLGTAARFFDSPAGRMLLAYGASNMLGDTNPLEQAVTAGAVNLNSRMNDRIYRNDLIANAKQQLLSNPEYNQLSESEKAQILNNLAQEENYSKLNDEQKARLLSDRENEYLSDRRNQQLQDVENNINGLRGFVTNDVYKNLINSQQIRDNYAYRNMMLNNQQEQNKIMNALRQDQLKAQQQQQAFNQWYQKANLEDKRADRAERRAYNNAQLGLTKRGQDLNYQLGQDRIKANQNKVDKKIQSAIQTNNAAVANIDRIIKMIDDNPQAIGYLKGSAAQGPKFVQGQLNKYSTNAEIALRGAITDLASMTLVDRTGTAQTAHEIKMLMPSLAQITDSPSTAKAKLKEMKNKINLETRLYEQNQGLSGGFVPAF